MVLRILSALADPTRLGALRLLVAGEELCVCGLMARLGVTQSRMSRHMGVLRDAGLVVDRRAAQWVHYRLNPDLEPQVLALVEAACALADPPPVRSGDGCQPKGRAA